MKKFLMLTIFAALAAILSMPVSAQSVVRGGGQQTATAPQTHVAADSPDLSGDNALNVHAWQNTYLESALMTLPAGELGNSNNGGNAFVTPKLKGETGVQGFIGDIFYLKVQSFYDISQTGLSAATLIGGPGVKLGPVSFGLNVGTDLMTWKGVKTGLDLSWDVLGKDELTLFTWADYQFAGGKNQVIAADGTYSAGKADYNAFDAGFGVDYFGIRGLYFGFLQSIYGGNNEWVTKSGNKTTVSSETIAKVGFVQDGRVGWLGVGFRGGERIVGATTDPKASNEFIVQVGYKWQ